MSGYFQSEVEFKNFKKSGILVVLCKIRLHVPLNIFAVLCKPGLEDEVGGSAIGRYRLISAG